MLKGLAVNRWLFRGFSCHSVCTELPSNMWQQWFDALLWNTKQPPVTCLIFCWTHHPKPAPCFDSFLKYPTVVIWNDAMVSGIELPQWNTHLDITFQQPHVSLVIMWQFARTVIPLIDADSFNYPGAICFLSLSQCLMTEKSCKHTQEDTTAMFNLVVGYNLDNDAKCVIAEFE